MEIDYRSVKQVSYVYTYGQAIRHNSNMEFEGFFELKYGTNNRKYFPGRLKLEKTEKYQKYHAIYQLSGKYCIPDRYFFISALRSVHYRKISIFYGDFLSEDTRLKSFFIGEMPTSQYLIIHYFREFMPSRCADFVWSAMESLRIKEIRKELFVKFNIPIHD
jgi:hypothetical protein